MAAMPSLREWPGSRSVVRRFRLTDKDAVRPGDLTARQSSFACESPHYTQHWLKHRAKILLDAKRNL